MQNMLALPLIRLVRFVLVSAFSSAGNKKLHNGSVVDAAEGRLPLPQHFRGIENSCQSHALGEEQRM